MAPQFIFLIRQLGTEKYHFIFVPNATRAGSEKTHNNDLLTIDSIRSQILESGIHELVGASMAFIDFDLNTAAIRKITSTADVMITSRYHSMIAGLSLAVPTIVIGWGHKYQETMQAFGMAEFVRDFSDQDFQLTKLENR